jgi:pyridoxine 5-phosphate synthase
MLKLGVNIDHAATLREARYRGKPGGEPDPVAAALQAEAAGAQGITAHLREDRRHLQDRDLIRLRQEITTRLNLEMANTPEMVGIALKVKPDIVCIVPEKRQEVTTEGGLDVLGQAELLRESISRIKDAGIEVSLFIAPDPEQVEASARVGAQFIELHTGSYGDGFADRTVRERELVRLVESAHLAKRVGLRVNAGHGLNVPNIPPLFVVPYLEELNIGHSILSRSIFVGLTAAVHEILEAMKGYPDGR